MMLQSSESQAWAERWGERRSYMLRILWEWWFIVQTLHEINLLTPGKRELGFAFGKVPLSELFACLGCEITATYMKTDYAAKSEAYWIASIHHASNQCD